VTTPLRLFQGYGIEIEYMIVDRETLDVRPLADKLLEAEAGELVSDVERGSVAWSNELVLHLIELKTNGPAPLLEPLPALFDADVRHINGLLEPMGARLMPTAMHPWMDPHKEMRLWPHDYGDVYRTFHRIFDCRGHGWANLQAVHLNLPFADDDEFGRLHAAIRFLLPVLPALAASSPFVGGHANTVQDNRLTHYRRNCRRVASVTGRVVPEPIATRAEYEETILGTIYADLADYDPDGILRHEWVNARGAIARFERNAIEIRVLDVQECPRADMTVAAAITAVLKGLVDGRLADPDRIRAWPTVPLAGVLTDVIQDADQTVLQDREWLAALGYRRQPVKARELWHTLLEAALPESSPEGQVWWPALHTILTEGPLSRRILAVVGKEPTAEALRDVYRRLCDCLERGEMLHA